MTCEREVVVFVAAAAAAYLVGSVNFAVIAGRLAGAGDPRGAGSGNAGANNLLRTAGWRVALLVLALDFARAAGVVLGARFVGPEELASLVVLPLLLGNLYPCFHGFRGGKGVAAVTGAFLAVDPIIPLLAGPVFLAVVGLFRRVSAGSMLMICSYPALAFLLGAPSDTVAVAGTCALAILFTHRANIRRLARGEEPRISVGNTRSANKEGA
ncbi:MAG: glycerol-3-phosphate acyltransferase [Deltaproteobacteria bacterium]|nr:glycerol-3-phosphate acyltransferase [Deltaproteobacteria bacterium]